MKNGHIEKKIMFIVHWIAMHIVIVNIVSLNKCSLTYKYMVEDSKFQTIRTCINIISDRIITNGIANLKRILGKILNYYLTIYN